MSKSHSDKSDRTNQHGTGHSNALENKNGNSALPPKGGLDFANMLIAGNGIIQMQQKQPVPAKPKSLCDIIADEVKIDESNIIRERFFTWEPVDLGPRRKLLKVCLAIESNDKKNIPTLLDTFLKSTHILDMAGKAPRLAGPVFNRDREDEIAARLRLMDMDSEADKIHLRKRKIHGGWMSGQAYDYGSRINSIKKLIEVAEKLAGSATDTTSAEKVIEMYLKVFKILFDQVKKLNKKELKQEMETKIGGHTGIGMGSSILDFYKHVMFQMREISIKTQLPFQIMMDSLIAKLGAATSNHDTFPSEFSKIKKHNTSLRKLMEGVVNEFPSRYGLLSDKVNYTKTDWDKMQSTDYFEGKSSKNYKSIGIGFYDKAKKKSSGSELKLTIDRVLIHREDQLAALKKIYSKEHAGLLKGLPGSTFKLHSIDDWRNFAEAKYDNLLNSNGGNSAEALFGVIDILSVYLNAFTFHTGYNIQDISSKPNSLNYLKRTFPRGLTGKIAQDCGVYALRIAFILSKIRAKAKLDFRFVLLPAHISLVIVQNGLPIVTVNNNHFNKTEPKLMASIKQTWDQTDRTGNNTGVAHGESDDQFIAEWAAQDFVGSHRIKNFSPSGNDKSAAANTPFRMFKVPEIKTTDKKEKDKYWKFYSKVVSKDLFDDSKVSKSLKQFHLHYLKYLKLQQQFWNDNVFPFWNRDMRDAWKKHQSNLKGKKALELAKELKATNGLKSTDKKRQEAEARVGPFEKEKDDYTAVITKAWQTRIYSGLYNLESKATFINDKLKSNPKLRSSGVGVAFIERVKNFHFFFFAKDFETYQKLLGNAMPDLWNKTKRPVYKGTASGKTPPSGTGAALIPPSEDYKVDYQESQF